MDTYCVIKLLHYIVGDLMLRADMHIHTKYSYSAKGKRECWNEPKKILKMAAKKRLDIIAITDHHTIRGGLEVKKLNKSKDLTVIVGSELRTNFGEFIAYNLNEEIETHDFYEAYDKAKSQGAVITIPHPFDKFRRSKLNEEGRNFLVKRKVMIEGINARTWNRYNKKAQAFAKKHRLRMTAGSDAHLLWEIGGAITYYKSVDDIGKPQGIKLETFPYRCLLPFAYTAVIKRI